MFKKSVVISVAVALILLGLYVAPSSAQNVASTSKRGSLLVWPMIKTGDFLDTIITIGNDSSKSVILKCYWMDKTQAAWDFEIELTPYQPVWFSAKTGWGTFWGGVSQFGSPNIGELKCWAITIPESPEGALEQLRQFNYLYGNALILDTEDPVRAFEYNAWAFYLNKQPNDAQSVNLDLDGDEYDYCPGYLVYNFFSLDGTPGGTATFGLTTLALSPCQQDVRQDKTPVCGKAKFDIWNENEIKFTGAYQCVKCWFEGVLSEIGTVKWPSCDLKYPSPGYALDVNKCKNTGVGGAKFTEGTLHTDLGRFRVSPDTWPACKGVFAKLGQDGKTVVDVCEPASNQFKTPFLGVRLTDVFINSFFEFPYVDPPDGWAGTTGTGAGAFTGPTQSGGFSPYIRWDRAENYQTPQR
jgi:hypothetical protein